MNKKGSRDEFITALEVKDQLEEYPELAKWAARYVKAAEAAGEDVDFDYYCQGGESLVGGTIKLICDLWPYEMCPFWLAMQNYGGPRLRGTWWIAEFSIPSKWGGARMYLEDPWSYAFAHLLQQSDQPTVQFEFRAPRRTRLTKTENAWLAEAVYDGMLHEYDVEDFGLICRKLSHSLGVDIFADYALVDALDGNRHLKPKKDHEGIYWYGQPQTKKAPKTKLNKNRKGRVSGRRSRGNGR